MTTFFAWYQYSNLQSIIQCKYAQRKRNKGSNNIWAKKMWINPKKIYRADMITQQNGIKLEVRLGSTVLVTNKCSSNDLLWYSYIRPTTMQTFYHLIRNALVWQKYLKKLSYSSMLSLWLQHSPPLPPALHTLKLFLGNMPMKPALWICSDNQVFRLLVFRPKWMI